MHIPKLSHIRNIRVNKYGKPQLTFIIPPIMLSKIENPSISSNGRIRCGWRKLSTDRIVSPRCVICYL